MRTLDAVFIVSAGIVAALEVALGVATLARSHHQQGANLSRGRRIVVPWLATCVYLFLALVFATLALQGGVEPGSDSNEPTPRRRCLRRRWHRHKPRMVRYTGALARKDSAASNIVLTGRVLIA